MPAYVGPAFPHTAAYATPPQRHDYLGEEHSYGSVPRSYPHGGGHYPPECGYSSSVMYRQREGYVPLEGSLGRPVYEVQPEDMYHSGVPYTARDNYPSKSSYMYTGYPQKRHSGLPQEPPDKKGEVERKTSVLSADSLEDVPLSPTSPVSPPLPPEARKAACYKDSLEDVRPRMVSELRDFFERQKSTTSTSSPESESFQESKTEEEEENEEEDEDEDEEDEDRDEDASKRKDMKKGDKQIKNPAADYIQQDLTSSVTSDQTEDASTTTECAAQQHHDSSSEDPTKDLYEEESDSPPLKLSPRHGDVAFLRATQDTPQTLLASTRLVQATLKPPAKATTFFISLGTKLKPPNFEDTKTVTKGGEKKENIALKENCASDSSDSSGGKNSPVTPGEDLSASSDPADYQESRLILRHFVHNWESESPPQEDSDIDEFFLVLDSTGGRGNFNFPSGSSSMLSSVGSSLSDQRSETTQSTDQDSFDDGNLADIGEPDTTSSSGLSPVQESQTEESSAPQTPEVLDQPEDKDGFLDTSHNVIVKPFLGLGKDIARESHAGPVLGSKPNPYLGSDSLLPIPEESVTPGRECETVIDTVFCDSDDECGHPAREEWCKAARDAPAAAARQASPCSDAGASCDTLCAASTPEGSRDTLCCSDETGRKVSSGQLKVSQSVVTGSRPRGQPEGGASGVAIHSGSVQPARGYAKPHDIRGNEVTSGSVARDATGESGTPDPSPGAALTLTPHTFDFTTVPRPTPDLEALATLIADRIMNGTVASTSVSAGASGSTSTGPAVPTLPTTTEGDEADASSQAVSGGCIEHHPQPCTSVTVPLALPPAMNGGESEVVTSSARLSVADVACKHSGDENSVLCCAGKEKHLWKKANKCVNMASCVSDRLTECSDSVETVPLVAGRGEALVSGSEVHPRKLFRQSPMTVDKGDKATEACVPSGGLSATILGRADMQPAMLRQDSRGSTCESLDSRKTSLGSTITSLDEEFSDMSPEEFFERRYSVSSGISSTSESTGRKFSTSSFASDDWEWFPGRKKSVRGHQWSFGEHRSEGGERGDLRKLSSVSTDSSTSSGIGSMESSGTESRKFSVNSGISCLSRINEECRTLTDADLSMLESFEEEHPVEESPASPGPAACHNITLDGRRLSLPPPVWPREAHRDVKEDVIEHKIFSAALEGKGDAVGVQEPEFIVKRAEILKTAHPGPGNEPTLDLPLICPSSCPLRRKDYLSHPECDHAHAHTHSLNSNDTREKRKSLNFVPRLLKPKSRHSARRLTLHTFENIAELVKKEQQAAGHKPGSVAPESVTNLSSVEAPQNDLIKEVEFRRNLVRDLEKLEAEIEAEVQALGSDASQGRDDDDAASTVVAFDSNESVASASSFSGVDSGAEDAPLPTSDTEPEFEAARPPVRVNTEEETRLSGRPQTEGNAEEPPSATLPDSKSLPNLLSSEGGKKLSLVKGSERPEPRREGGKPARSMDTLLNEEEIVPCSNYEFSEVAFPPMVSLDEVEEQEVIENFSDEDLVSDADFEAFSETEHDDTDLDHLNLELFELSGQNGEAAAQRLTKRQKKMKKIRRKFSFSSKEKQPKDMKDAISSSLKRLKTAKQKIEQLVTKTLRSDQPSCPSSAESAAGSPPSPRTAEDSCDARKTRPEASSQNKDSHCSKASETQLSVASETRGPEEAEGAGSASRRTSKSSDDWSAPGPWDSRLPDGHESAYSWSDADSDFEFVAMEPPRPLPVTQEAEPAARETGPQEPTAGKHSQPAAAPGEDREVRPCHRPSNSLRSSKVPLATWEPFFCVLLQDEKTFTSYRSEEMSVIPGAPIRPHTNKLIGDSLFYDLPRMRLDGGARAFRRRWGYELTPPPTLVEEENEDDPYDLPPNHEEDNLSYTETRSLRDDYLFSSSQGKTHQVSQ
ncbi:uncharacterized protein LOC135103039 isoform X1 [Scylla paramamosain]|uniref:uncharacterized protein LOC135103039 isoform X1 n=1 Tax=Scylla paramamosain TaxID=85552 RepID=UPI003083619A